MDKQLLRWFICFFLFTISQWEISEAQVGFSLNGVTYPNGSTVMRTDIGEGDNALLCITDDPNCCSFIFNRAGEFYFPDGTLVPNLGGIGSSGYYRNRDIQLIRLNRQSQNGVITGQFHCEIPLSTNINSILYVNIVDIEVSSTPSSGTNTSTAGEIYGLTCSVSVNGSTAQPSITWLDDNDVEVDSITDATRTVTITSDSAGSYSSTLTFNPLGTTDTGTYTCRATLGGAEVNGSTEVVINGVYLSLRGMIYANNSVIPITEIGETDPITAQNEGLQCVTDRRPCCGTPPNRFGEWYFPNGTAVPSIGSARSFYRSRGDDGTVNLNHHINDNLMSPAGHFCCEVPDATDTAQVVCVYIVIFMITPIDSPTPGETFSLDCSLNGATNPVTYQWFEGPASSGVQLTNVSQLQFSPLLVSHAGLYTCQVTMGDLVMEETSTVTVNLPAPTAVIVPPLMGTIIAGSSPNLTCTVELSPVVNVPVTVNAVWNAPAGTTVTPTSSMMESLTRYTIVAIVDAARGGNYTCRATLSSPSQFITDSEVTSGSTTITVAPLPAPISLTVSSPTPTSIALTWEQPEEADAVDSYEISYEYSVHECSGEGGSFPALTVIVNNGSLRSYTLNNSSSAPVEADSTFFITLLAINSVTRSDPTPPVQVMTADAAPGAPQSLRIALVDVTNITIQWDRVGCLDRNGRTDSYVVIYHPTSNPNRVQAATVSGTGDSDRVFSLPGLPPRISYTFQVEANNPLIRDPGAVATINISTTAPQSVGFLLDGRLYPNNSVVTLTDIGNGFFGPALYCLTPSTECCSSIVSGEWYLPDGTPVSSSTTPFSRNQVPSAVNLLRNVLTPPTGVFRCEIPDASGIRQDMYVGIYHEGDGSPSIISMVFDRNLTTLTCTSTGGPPTTVTWRKNGVLVNESLFQQSQRLVDAESATFENILFNNDVSNFVGTFTCAVSNVRGTNGVTVELNGVSITLNLFIVSQSTMVRCISDTPAIRMEWLNAEGVLITSATSTQQLDLVFSLVNDSIHDQVYVCRVTRDEGVIATQNFTTDVVVPPTAITAVVSSSGIARAGMVYNLTCTVSKMVDGLINSPTATWTTAGVAVSSGNGITVSTMTANENAAISTLTFDPLRTSHDGRYSCDGTLTSPALDTPLMPSTVVAHRVQISTPDVDITVPSGPLFAGSTTPLTLTCTISINPATDTDVSVTADMDVTWMRGTTELPDGDARVTISSVSGSQPSFISTLTLDPLSIVDNTTFTCQARARPPANQQSFITASEVGDSTISVIINSPSPPSVSIALSSSIAVAGQPLTRTCSASVQDGISGTPTLIWTRNGMELPGEGSSGSLSFSPLHTSHGGVYTCIARLTIPEAGVDVSGTDTIAIVVQIPSPTLTIIGSPRDTGFFRGLILTFTCLIEINPAVDTSVTVQGSWKRNGISLESSSNGRITVINTGLAGSPYQSQVRFNPTDLEDAGTYNCSARIIPQNSNLVLEATTFITRVITVLNFPPQIINVTDGGVSSAGYSGYTLICTTNREADLPSSSTLTIQWLNPDGNAITTGNGFTISGTQGPSNDISLTSRLTFSTLLTSQAGLYTCRTLLTIPGTVVDHSVEYNFAVTVKLPAPEVVTIQGSRGAPVYEGTMFSLICLITPNMTGVDTDVTVQRNFTGPGTSAINRVTRDDIELQTTLLFRPVAMTDDGRYTCSAAAISTPQYPYVDVSDITVNDTTIEISMLPPPVVSITSTPNPTAGQSHTLDCFARTEDYVIGVPDLEWVSIDSTDTSITQPEQTNGTVSSNLSLTFDPIHTSHGRRYTCRASINIPQANVIDRRNTGSEDVRVQIPTSIVVVNEGSFPAYNGTVFNLTGIVQLDLAVVDIDVTVVWVWSLTSKEMERQNTTSSPHQITISFQPLATNSSGLYRLNLTILPINSEYVVGNSDSSTSYNLVVQRLPVPVPSITITARAAHSCSEARNFTCTATTVDNIFSPPTIEWWYRGNRVPLSGNPRMDSTMGELIFDDIITDNSGDYTCRASITIPEADIDNHYNETTTAISTDMPAKVQNLMCVGSSPTMSLSLTWERPVAQGSGVIGYRVKAQRVEQRPSRELVSLPLSPTYYREIGETQAEVILGLQAEVPYNITVRAVNLAGCGEEEQVYCFTQEGEPPAPENVVVVRFDSTSIGVSWTKFTLVELKGLANYIITYNVIISSRKRQFGGTIIVPWTQNQVIISDLQPGAEYDVTIRTSTTAGMSAPVGPGGTRISTTTSQPPTAAAPGSSTSDNTVAIIGGIVAVVIVIVIAATILIAIALVLRSRRAEFNPNQKSLAYEEPRGVMLSDLSTTNKEREVYETIEADHEYEILDKYSQAYEEVQAPPPKPELPVQPQPPSSAGDYELTQCPAYVPMTTTSIHGNTNKPDTPTSTEPITTQDDQKDN